MKRLLLASAALLAAGCGHNYASSVPQIPVAPTMAAQLAPQVPNAVAPPAPAAQPATAPAGSSSRTDYSVPANWLCKPGVANNPCEVNIDATIVKADGSTELLKYAGNPNAPIDCFYVYPTVSLDPFTQSDLIPGPEEFNVVKSQLARLGSQCRIFAPMYRQFSLGALRARMSGGAGVPTRGTPADANADVDDAWAWYLANENKGRGVVILGHSQGSGQITRLIAAKVDGKPDQAKLVSAIIMGSTIQVPKGADVGGTFRSIPVCKTAGQTGCVISFSSFRDTVPPAETSNFGINRGETEAVCVNPAALGGGKATSPKAYWSTADKAWATGKKIDTPFVMTPGLTTTECVRTGKHHYLQVHFNADAADARIDDPGTDVMAQGKPDPNWGLHLNDANIVMGDLVDVVGKQSAAWTKAHP
ncbi:MAG: DUF3089 domain-containing protein [Hyphomonadaceae bacterium]|nr:DUF3089 domain-containing protein [Hyphomonadaceae bacterium]